MTAITQKIDNLVGGISQQPDSKQVPGTVKDALNVIPDIKGLLSKRPGSELIGTLSDDTSGKWHHYYRDDDEQYFIRVRRDGQVDAWDALTAKPALVYYSPTPTDLEGVTSPSISDDAKPICDTCIPAAFTATLDALEDARDDLVTTKDRIQEINVELENGPNETLEQEKATLEASIQGKLTAYDNALAAFEDPAEKCGVYNNPYSRAVKAACAEPNLIPYLSWDKRVDDDPDNDYLYDDSVIQLTTINDYTFVVNRSVQVQMDEGVDPDPIPKAFLYLNTLEPATQYIVNFWDDQPSAEGPETSVKQASNVALRQSYSSINGNGKPSANETIVRTDAASGITYRLDVQRVQYQEGDKGPDNYWNAQVYFVSADPSIESGVGITADWTVTVLERDWTIYVSEDTTYTTSADATISVGPYAVEGSNNTTMNAATILSDLKTEFEAEVGEKISVKVVGNGLLLTSKNNKEFVIDTPTPQVITTINSEVNNVAQLPTQCEDGYIVKVVNSFLEEDDYYVKFVAKRPGTGTDDNATSVGVWEETFKPGIEVGFDYKTMPHAIRRVASGAFEVSPIKWARREVGDNVTNPKPSFVGQNITKMMFFRNRFVYLAGENVFMSRPNEYFNNWAFTAQTVSDADPIDLLVASTYPAILYDGVETVGGLMLFASNQQFMVVTDNTDVFSPKTASVKSIGSYKYNKKVRPVHMGQTVGFLNNAGYRSRFFELIPNRDFDSKAVESSKPVDQLIPKNINRIADSKDENMLAFAEEGKPDVWIFRYFDSGDERIQAAWFRWKLSGDILYHAVMDDKYYAVLSVETGNAAIPRIATLQQFDLKLDRDTILIRPTSNEMRQYDYGVHMDNYFMAVTSEVSYVKNSSDPLDQVFGPPPADVGYPYSTWRLPVGYHGDAPVSVYELMMNPDKSGYVTTGRFAVAEIKGITNGVRAYVKGNWKQMPLLCGYNFDMEVKLNTIYPQSQKDRKSFVTDTRSSLVLHRVKMNFDVTGILDTIVDRKGREPYTVQYEASIQDGYIANDTVMQQDVTRVVPIYDRNTNTDITLKSTYPTPTNLVSVEWEGDYNNRYYRRV